MLPLVAVAGAGAVSFVALAKLGLCVGGRQSRRLPRGTLTTAIAPLKGADFAGRAS
jgi:hypothetical protein